MPCCYRKKIIKSGVRECPYPYLCVSVGVREIMWTCKTVNYIKHISRISATVGMWSRQEGREERKGECNLEWVRGVLQCVYIGQCAVKSAFEVWNVKKKKVCLVKCFRVQFMVRKEVVKCVVKYDEGSVLCRVLSCSHSFLYWCYAVLRGVLKRLNNYGWCTSDSLYINWSSWVPESTDRVQKSFFTFSECFLHLNLSTSPSSSALSSHSSLLSWSLISS